MKVFLWLDTFHKFAALCLQSSKCSSSLIQIVSPQSIRQVLNRGYVRWSILLLDSCTLNILSHLISFIYFYRQRARYSVFCIASQPCSVQAAKFRVVSLSCGGMRQLMCIWLLEILVEKSGPTAALDWNARWRLSSGFGTWALLCLKLLKKGLVRSETYIFRGLSWT